MTMPPPVKPKVRVPNQKVTGQAGNRVQLECMVGGILVLVMPSIAGVNKKPLVWHFHARSLQNFLLVIYSFGTYGIPLIGRFKIF